MTRFKRKSAAATWLVPALALAGAVSTAGPALAQGCVCVRQSQPVFGTGDPYLKAKEFQLSSTYRYNYSNKLYSGSDVAAGAPKVRREQHIVDVAGTYALDQQTNVTLTVPFADLRFGLGVPSGDPDVAHTSGIGDVTLVARRWLMNCPEHPKQNVSVGFGIKLPTGNYDARDSFRNGAGVRDVRYLDISSQPGDGGVGLIFDLQAFKQFKEGTAFLSGTYLANPRNTNGTPSLMAGLMGSAVPASIRVNSVPDQFIVRGGGAIPIKSVQGLSLSLAGRLEGVPVGDLFGSEDGFRFAGYVVFIEPGLVYTRGADTLSIGVPVRVHGKIRDTESAPGPDMGTLVPYSVIVSYAHRFGKGR